MLQIAAVSGDRLYAKSQTALHVAASRGLAALCRSLLLEAGVEVDEQDKYGRTALHWAAIGGRKRAVNSVPKLHRFEAFLDRTVIIL